jgi:hypothetical protein
MLVDTNFTGRSVNVEVHQRAKPYCLVCMILGYRSPESFSHNGEQYTIERSRYPSAAAAVARRPQSGRPYAEAG